MSKLRLTLKKSPTGYSQDQKGTVLALGLRRLHQTVEKEATPTFRGMAEKVRHLLKIEEIP